MAISDHDQTKRSSSQKPQERITEHQSSSLGKPKENGGTDGNDSQRLSRSDSKWRNTANPIYSVIGGIIKQSRFHIEERLQEYEDCLVWYENGKNKVLKQLEELDQLEEQLSELFTSEEE